MYGRLRYLMLEGWYILVVHVTRTGHGVIWYTADGLNLHNEKFINVTGVEFKRLRDIFPVAKRI